MNHSQRRLWHCLLTTCFLFSYLFVAAQPVLETGCCHLFASILLSFWKEEIHFSHPEFHKREAALMGSRNATRSDFEYVIDSIKNKRANPLKYITHKVAFNNLATAFPSYLKPETGVIKAMVEME